MQLSNKKRPNLFTLRRCIKILFTCFQLIECHDGKNISQLLKDKHPSMFTIRKIGL